jgi:ferredoxin
MARVEVDRTTCTALGICESLASDVFEVGDDGELVVLLDPVPADQLDAVRDAVAGCPTGALALRDTGP